MTWLLIPLLGMAYWITGVTWEAPPLEGGSWQGAGEHAWAGGHNVPTWTRQLAREFPGCGAAASVFGDRVVIMLDGTARRMSFDEVAERSHDASRATDVWVVGVCPIR